ADFLVSPKLCMKSRTIFLSTPWVVRNLLISKLVIRNGGVSALELHPIVSLSSRMSRGSSPPGTGGVFIGSPSSACPAFLPPILRNWLNGRTKERLRH